MLNVIIRCFLCFSLFVGTSFEFSGISKHFLEESELVSISEMDYEIQAEILQNEDDCDDCEPSGHCRHHCNGLHLIALSNPVTNIRYQTHGYSFFLDANLKIPSPFLKCPGQPPNLYSQSV